MRRARRSTLATSPVLVGATTLLIAVVAVVISYQSNAGLPFLPTYKVKAELPNAAKVVPGNQVRAGGFLVGTVKKVTPARKVVEDEERSIAVLHLELDKQLDPLSVDTKVNVRARSALGLKYVEVVPGRGEQTFEDGDTIPLSRTVEAPDLDDVFSTFAPETRDDARKLLTGSGDAFAGRGSSLNIAIGALNPFLARLGAVMRNLSDPDTELRRLVPALAAAAGEAAPVAGVQVRWIAAMADTFAAVRRDPGALQDTIAESAPTLDAATASLRVQTPFLARLADLSRRLRPAAAELPVTLPAVNAALRAGPPAFRRTADLASDLEDLFASLEDLGRNPSSLLALRDLRRGAQIARPAVEYVAPYQTVCNYLVYFFNPLGTHQSEAVAGGTAERILAKLLITSTQANSLGTTQSTRPVDVPSDVDPQGEPVQQALHSQPGGPAVDASGRADCQAGQSGYMNRLVTDGRYPPDDSAGGFLGGGSHVVLDRDTPGAAGGTFKARELGIDGTEDVP
jgi:virulence factor Mce-like protein